MDQATAAMLSHAAALREHSARLRRHGVELAEYFAELQNKHGAVSAEWTIAWNRIHAALVAETQRFGQMPRRPHDHERRIEPHPEG
jgi:hypothetical protein